MSVEAVPVAVDSSLEPSARSAAARRELRGTVLIAFLLAAIVGSGWIAAALVARAAYVVGPGVELHRGPGWGETWIGPTGVGSHRMSIGASVLIVAPDYDEPSLEALLQSYRATVIEANDNDAAFAEASDVFREEGEAVIQHWTSVTEDGRPTVGELTVVVEGRTGVILDARWPADERPTVVDEIRRTSASLAIEPFAP